MLLRQKYEEVAPGRDAVEQALKESERWFQKRTTREGAKSLSRNGGLSFYINRTLAPL